MIREILLSAGGLALLVLVYRAGRRAGVRQERKLARVIPLTPNLRRPRR